MQELTCLTKINLILFNIIFGNIKYGNVISPKIFFPILYLACVCFVLSTIKLTPPIGEVSTTCQTYIKCYKIIICKIQRKPITNLLLSTF